MNCPNCFDGGDIMPVFYDEEGGWVWHCDSCGYTRLMSVEEVEELLNPDGVLSGRNWT